MEISKKTDYALRMLATLVRNPSGRVTAREAADENDVPYSFARSIEHDLAAAGIVSSVRGANGGMQLTVDPRQTTLLQVVEAVQGPVSLSGCELYEEASQQPSTRPVPDFCPRYANCCYAPVWCTSVRMLREFFSSVTLYELLIEEKAPVFEGAFTLESADVVRARLGQVTQEQSSEEFVKPSTATDDAHVGS